MCHQIYQKHHRYLIFNQGGKNVTNPDYNFSEFTAGESGASAEFIQNSPKATSKAPAFALEELDTGEIIRMQDLWKSETIIVEFGSFT